MTEGKIFGQAPAIDLDVEAARQKALLTAIQNQDLFNLQLICQKVDLQLHFVKKHSDAEGLGVDVTISGSAVTALFSETQSRFLVTVKEENAAAFEKAVTDAIKIGAVTDSNRIVINGENGSVN